VVVKTCMVATMEDTVFFRKVWEDNSSNKSTTFLERKRKQAFLQHHEQELKLTCCNSSTCISLQSMYHVVAGALHVCNGCRPRKEIQYSVYIKKKLDVTLISYRLRAWARLNYCGANSVLTGRFLCAPGSALVLINLNQGQG
jgi:hypothetical protein